MSMRRRAFVGAGVGSVAVVGAGSAYIVQERQRAAETQAALKAEEERKKKEKAKEKPKPVFPHEPFDTVFLTWQRDPTTTMTVQWLGKTSELPRAELTCRANAGGLWQVKPVLTKPFPMTDLLVFRCELTNLAPGQEYQFRIGANEKTYRFRTMPAKATDAFQFVTGGDSGIDDNAVANNKVAAKQDPMFAVIGGDIAYENGREPHVFRQFLRNYSKTMLDGQGRCIPLLACLGNHEVDGGYGKPREKAPFFFSVFDGLFSERSYTALDFGDYLSLVLLDTGHISSIDGEQTRWLETSLRNRADCPHLIVANHVPAYPSFRRYAEDEKGAGTGDLNRKHWVPLFEKYAVDVVLEHHDHTFKRTHPLKNGRVDKNGILYLGDGSWGKLRAPKSPEERPYLAAVGHTYHMTLHRLEGDRRFHMAISNSGRIVDICTTGKKPRGHRA